MDKINIIESPAVLVPVDNIDTDQIIPCTFPQDHFEGRIRGETFLRLEICL